MKIQFIKPYTDPYDSARIYKPGWVAEFTDPDAERAIADGFAKPAPADAFSRKYLSIECAVPNAPLAGEINTTGEVTDLGGLLKGKTYSAMEVEAAEKKRGFSFTKSGSKK